MLHSVISLRIIWWTGKPRPWLGLGNEQPAAILACSAHGGIMCHVGVCDRGDRGNGRGHRQAEVEGSLY